MSDRVMKPSPLLGGRRPLSGRRGYTGSEADESLLDVRLDVLDPQAAAESNDETLMTNASVSSGLSEICICLSGIK